MVLLLHGRPRERQRHGAGQDARCSAAYQATTPTRGSETTYSDRPHLSEVLDQGCPVAGMSSYEGILRERRHRRQVRKLLTPGHETSDGLSVLAVIPANPPDRNTAHHFITYLNSSE